MHTYPNKCMKIRAEGIFNILPIRYIEQNTNTILLFLPLTTLHAFVNDPFAFCVAFQSVQYISPSGKPFQIFYRRSALTNYVKIDVKSFAQVLPVRKQSVLPFNRCNHLFSIM